MPDYSKLSQRIDKFIAKAVIHIEEGDAEKYGIKLPPKPEGPKWEHADKIPQAAELGDRKAPYPAVMPKLPKTGKPKKTKIPEGVRPRSHYQKVPVTAAEEVAHQLSPKGPGYHSPEEIAADVRESKRLAYLMTGQKNKQSSETE